MIPSNRSRCVEHLRAAAHLIELNDPVNAGNCIRVALLLMWDRKSIQHGDCLLSCTTDTRNQWLAEREP